MAEWGRLRSTMQEGKLMELLPNTFVRRLGHRHRLLKIAIPNRTFLRHVQEGKVRQSFRYHPKRGPYWVILGGDNLTAMHVEAGYVQVPQQQIMSDQCFRLTEAGRKFLEDSE